MSERTVAAAEFKAKCLQLMDEVERTRSSLVVTKRGRPVVKLVPAGDELPPLRGCMKGTVTIHGDIVGPLGLKWNALEE